MESMILYLENILKMNGMAANEILVLDIETTGLHPEYDFILELGIVKLNTDTGHITPLFDKIFKDPNLRAKHRNAWIFQNGYMHIDEVRTAQPLDNYRNEIQEILNPYKGKITAWNRDFDHAFLIQNGFDLGSELACPMKAWRRTTQNWSTPPFAALAIRAQAKVLMHTGLPMMSLRKRWAG